MPRFERSTDELIHQARAFRKEPTQAEEVLWNRLRRRHVAGAHFRRQHPMGRFIADFYCDDARLVIEVDGSVHLERSQRERDDARDCTMRQFGLAVLRFTNGDVMARTEDVVQTIATYVAERRQSAPSPALPGRRRGARPNAEA